MDKEAQEAADSLLEVLQEQDNPRELTTAYAFRGELALARDEVEEAGQWLELAEYQGWQGSVTFFEDPRITTARLLLALDNEGSLARGEALLDGLLRKGEAMNNTRKTIKVLALRAWAYNVQGRMTEALAVLEYALGLGRPGRFIRAFADLPQLAPLLGELRRRLKANQALDKQLNSYLERLMAALHPHTSQLASGDKLLRQEGLEPLTGRELDILRLLDQGFMSKEIARELAITPGTVKVHLNNLYRKLAVNNRRSALALARANGLLEVK